MTRPRPIKHHDPLFDALGPQDAAATRRHWDHGSDPIARDERYGTPLVRSSDPTTSHAAAAVIEKVLSELQLVVLLAYADHGKMSARTIERIDYLDEYGFSTIRKRVSELSKSGHLVKVGEDTSRRTPIAVWDLSDKGRAALRDSH